MQVILTLFSGIIYSYIQNISCIKVETYNNGGVVLKPMILTGL